MIFSRVVGLAVLLCGAAAQQPPTPGFDSDEMQSIINSAVGRARLLHPEQDLEEAEIRAHKEEAAAGVCVPIPDTHDPSRTARITVSQFEAAKDAHAHHNRILKMVTQYFNAHFNNIVRVNIEYEGEALSGKIGQYEITTHFSRNVDSTVVNECRTIEYWVEDINECEQNLHKCHDSTVCVNTIGSYECQCKFSDYFGVENSGSVSSVASFLGKRQEPGRCGRMKDTAECCAAACSRDRTSACFERCKEDFKCSNNPCEFNKCSEHAMCIPDHSLHTYNCQCKPGYQGNGFGCEKYTPPDHCAGNPTCVYPCQCVNRLADGGYSCEAPSGMISVHNPFGVPLPSDHKDKGGARLDHNFCFSKHGMDLSLDGPNPVTYRQGDTYEEHGLQVSDSQPENFVRKVQIDYSAPFGAYFRVPGQFEVTYTIQTPWLGAETNITKIRNVIVTDVDECTYNGPIEAFRHDCSASARCVNTPGSFECRCPAGYEGDARAGGSGCVDSRPPRLACAGKGCSVMHFKAVSCVGIMSEDGRMKEILEGTDLGFVDTFLEMQKQNLCSAEDPCFTAFDETLEGRVDLTSEVKLGQMRAVERRERSILFELPYAVSDAAGNTAGPLSLSLLVEIIDVADHISGAFVSVRKETFLGWTSIIVLILLVLIGANLTRLLKLLRSILYALQYVFHPFALIVRRQDFEEGMELYLQVMSFGTLSKTDRARKIASKWNELIEANSED